jgi:hypothetical protein
MNRTEQEAEALEDQDGSALEDGSGPAATSLAHLRPGKFQYFLKLLNLLFKWYIRSKSMLLVRTLTNIILRRAREHEPPPTPNSISTRVNVKGTGGPSTFKEHGGLSSGQELNT